MSVLKKNLANFITSVRLVGAVVLIFLPPLSAVFLIVYTICGISDAIDGTVARLTGSASTFGAKLDSASDLLFYLVMMLKMLPELIKRLPGFIWYIVALDCVLRIIDYSYTAIKFHRFASMHTILNKLTGGMMFLIPYTMHLGQPFTIYGFCITIVALLAAVQELTAHLRLTPDKAGNA